MIVSTLLEPEQHHLWSGILQLLETAAGRYGQPAWEDGFILWVVIDGRQIIAAITGRQTDDGEAEILSIAGHRALEWLPEADRQATEWAKAMGARTLSGRGRAGWERLLTPLGWSVAGQAGKSVIYEKAL